jgi:uncharacterized protein YjbI with pentapeptide repeats
MEGVSLPGVNLRYANLAGTDLSLSSLSGADLSNANLSSGGLVGTDLSNANLSSANLTGVSLAVCIVFGIHGVACLDANLTDANLTGANFTNAILSSCATSFLGTGCGSADFTGTLLVPSNQIANAASAAGAVVTWPTPQSLPGLSPGTCSPPSGSTFSPGTSGVSCQVLGDNGDVASGFFTVTVNPLQTITSISLPSYPSPSVVGQQVNYAATVSPIPPGGTVTFTDNGSSMAGCSAVPVAGDGIASCVTTESTAGSHNIVATYSGYSNSAGVNFPGSTSPGITQNVLSCHAFAGCNLSGLDLTGANLPNLDLHGANLSRANLSGADLSSTDLAGANLLGANLSGADLSGANLKGANLGNVTWANTACPDGTNSNNDGGTCVGHL